MKEFLRTPRIQSLENIGELASKFGIKIDGTAFDVRCPAIKNSLETMGIEISWASSEPNTVEAQLFAQFENALRAVKYAAHVAQYGTDKGASFTENKWLYTLLNVYGRAMFINIVERMEFSAKPFIYKELSDYHMERLDFDTYGYDHSTKVIVIYDAHIASTVNPWVKDWSYIKKAHMGDKMPVVRYIDRDCEFQTNDQNIYIITKIDKTQIPMAGDTVLHGD